MKIAVFLPGWIGDTVMATPAFQLLRDFYPNADITAVGRKPMDDLLSGSNQFDHFIPRASRINPLDIIDGVAGEIHSVRELRRQKFDKAILFSNSMHTALLAYLSNIPERIGFNRHSTERFLTRSLNPKTPANPNPIINEYIRLAKFETHNREKNVSLEMKLEITRRDEKKFFETLCAFPVLRNGYLLFNPGGAFGASKHWPTKSFSRLADLLLENQHLPILVMCGPGEENVAKEIAQNVDSKRIVALSESNIDLSIGLSKSLVKNSSLLVTTDSGPRHFAPAFDVPVVSLFGATHQEWTDTHFDKETRLQKKLPCGPCQKRVCPLSHHDCMKQLKPESVFRAAMNLLGHSEIERTRKAA